MNNNPPIEGGTKTRPPNMKEVYAAIDWVSVKLCGISTPFLFINPSKISVWLGVVALTTTILYNSVRIYKEFKNKK